MKTGTIETKVGTEKIGRRLGKTGRFGSSGGLRLTGGDGDGFGGDGPRRSRRGEPGFDRLRVGMLAGLFTMSIFFALFAGSYAWVSSKSLPNWKPFEFPAQVWLGTFFIAASGAAYEIAGRAFLRKKHGRAKGGFAAALILGAAFLAAQISSWIALTGRHIGLNDNPFGIYFYTAGALCGLCVCGGLAPLGLLTPQAGAGRCPPAEFARRRAAFEVLGWYWRFTVAVCLFLYALINFWKYE